MATRLNPWHVQQIIASYKRGHSLFQLSHKFDVHQDTIRKVLSGTHKLSEAILEGKSILRNEADTEITPKQVEAIRNLAAGGVSIRRLAKKYHVGHVTIRSVCEGVPLVMKKPSPVEPNKPERETIFTWAKRWEKEYDLRREQK